MVHAFGRGIDPTVLEHEAADLLAMDPLGLDRRRPGTHQIPHRLVAFVGHPHRGQLAGAQQPRKRNGVPAVGLHPIAGLPRDQRRRNHGAFVTEQTDQPIETVAGRPCLVAEIDPIELGGDPLNNAAHARIRCVDLAEEANLPLPAGVRNRNGVPQLRDIDSDKCFL